MSDLNQCNFIGRLGKDPETKYMSNGDPVTNFSIAVGEQWKDKHGEKQEKTEWINVVAWRKLGEICGEYLTKGSQVMISGKMTTRKWQDQEGRDRYTTEIIANSMQMLGARGEAKPAPAEQRPAAPQQPGPASHQPAPSQPPQQPQQPQQPEPGEFIDEIPF